MACHLVGHSSSPRRAPSVALVVTSPPYFAGKEYEEALGHGHIPATYFEYLDMLGAVFAECVRKLEPGGRIAVNVANLGRRPYRSLSADVIAILAGRPQAAAARRGDLAEGAGSAGSCAWGSFQKRGQPGAARPHRAGRHREQGSLRSRAVRGEREAEDLPCAGSMSRDEFMEATTDVWEIPPESASRVGHPAPFPVELPEAAHRPLHLQRRPRARSVHGFRHDRGRRRPHRSALRRVRHRRGVRRGGPDACRASANGRPSAPIRTVYPVACCRRPERRPTTKTSRPVRCARARRRRTWRGRCSTSAVSEIEDRDEAPGGVEVNFRAEDARGVRGTSTCRARSRANDPGSSAPTRCGRPSARRW